MNSNHLADSATLDGGSPAISELLDSANAALRDLVDGCPPGDPMRNGLRKVQATMERLTALTGERYGMSRRNGGRAAPVDVNSVVREMVPPLQRLLGPFITLDTTLQTPSLWISGDRSQMEQVTLGLVINAREALPLGGKVYLSTRQMVLPEPTRHRIGTLPAGTWTVIEVRDNGAHVDSAAIRHLLEPNPRGLPADSSLSLTTVASIVKEAGGHVILDMPSAGGTLLAACFPSLPTPRSRQPATGTASAVLIVDKDEWSRMSAARTLRHAGFGVLEAGHIDDALELLDDVAGSCVRLMIVDAKLLTSDAQSLGDRLRHERPEIELMVTATHRGVAGAGDLPLLLKPFAPEELLGAIRTRLAH